MKVTRAGPSRGRKGDTTNLSLEGAGQGTGVSQLAVPANSGSGGYGTRNNDLLGATSPFQALVRYLPRDFPADELTDYVKEMLRVEEVQVEVLWRRGTAAFIVTVPWQHRRVLLSGENWAPHVHVKPFFPRDENVSVRDSVTVT